MYRPYFHVLNPAFRYPRGPARPWAVPDLLAAYRFPKVTGPVQAIGIIELGGGYRTADIQTAFAAWNLPAPVVTDVSVQGGHNTPGQDADGEVVLDLEIAACAYSFCTGVAADIRMYFAPNTDAGFLAALTQAIADGCSVVSISWGSAEKNWTGRAIPDFTTAAGRAGPAGCTLFAASGDNDSGDGLSGVNVDFPASCPWIVGCGGTMKTATAEVVWNDGNNEGTGGGYSAVFPVQSFQVGVPIGTGRMVPDLAANAAPSTGYSIFLNGEWQPIGGTSAVAPLMAGLFAAYNAAMQTAGKPKLGFCLDRLYRWPAGFIDVTVGNNGRWTARQGPDPCTGLGVPDGTELLGKLIGSIPAPPTPPIPVPTPIPIPPGPGPIPPPVTAVRKPSFSGLDLVSGRAVDQYLAPTGSKVYW